MMDSGKKRLTELQDKLKKGMVAEEKQAALDALENQIVRLAYSPEKHQDLRDQEAGMQEIEGKFRKLDSARAAQAASL